MTLTIRNHTLKKYIAQTLLGAISFVFLISLIAGIFIERDNAKMEHIEKIHDTHTTLISVLAPELAIYNIMEVRKLLSLASSHDKFFAVIDNNKNVYMSDYENFGSIRKLIYKAGRVDCRMLNKEKKDPGKNVFFYCTPIYYYSQDTESNAKLGVLISYSKLDFAFRSWKLLMEYLLAFFVISSLVFILLRRNLYKKLLSPLIKLERQISKLDSTRLQTNTNIGDIGWAPIEIQKIKEAFDQLLNCLHIENMKIRETEKKATLSHLAVQIAHDIRSPLAALEVIVVEANKFPERKRLLIRHSINRINDIANNLLTQYRLINKSGKEETENNLTSELLSALMDMVISEKRLQLNRSNIRISFEIDESAHGTCVNINPSLFERGLSNILNNAIESIVEHGEIKLYLGVADGNAIIKIIDNGCGIPEHLLPLLLKGGTSHGKKNGFGLGLSSAVSNIQSWNGTVTIESKKNQGTTVNIHLPLAKSPPWFAERIFFNKNNLFVVVVDDEESVHQIWNNRFESLSTLFDFKMIHLNTPTELMSWCKMNDNASVLFLVDYQFENSEINGIELIKYCGIESSAMLVTSCYDSDGLRDECLHCGVKLLPKFFSAYIPIEVTEAIKVDLIFLDDDCLITNTWELACELKNIKINTFNEVNTFLQAIRNYAKSTPIYIDSELTDNIKGEEIARDLYMVGYRELYLVTGKSHDSFSELYWIKSIAGKNCPYIN